MQKENMEKMFSATSTRLFFCSLAAVSIIGCETEWSRECGHIPMNSHLSIQDCRAINLEMLRLQEKQLGLPSGVLAPKKQKK